MSYPADEIWVHRPKKFDLQMTHHAASTKRGGDFAERFVSEAKYLEALDELARLRELNGLS